MTKIKVSTAPHLHDITERTSPSQEDADSCIYCTIVARFKGLQVIHIFKYP